MINKINRILKSKISVRHSSGSGNLFLNGNFTNFINHEQFFQLIFFHQHDDLEFPVAGNYFHPRFAENNFNGNLSHKRGTSIGQPYSPQRHHHSHRPPQHRTYVKARSIRHWSLSTNRKPPRQSAVALENCLPLRSPATRDHSSRTRINIFSTPHPLLSIHARKSN